jgi:hypothetical protein
MTCDQVQQRLSDFLDGSLADAEGAAVLSHVGQCPRCAAEADGLRETIALLKSLLPLEAPPELLERISDAVGPSRAGTKPSLWRTLFLPAHVKIPLEAAAAVLLFLLVYGLPAGTPRMKAPSPAAPPAATLEASPPASVEIPGGAEPGWETGIADAADGGETEAAETTRADAAADLLEAGAAAPPQPASRAPAHLPPATLASTDGRPVAPAPRAWEPRGAFPQEEAAPGRLFAAPPSGLLRPSLHGREVVLEVPPDVREGVEERIALAALRVGGSPAGEPSREGGRDDPETAFRTVRVLIPAAATEAFLAEIRTIGIVPADESPDVTDLPAAPAADIVAYTVRIRVR